MQQTLLTVSSVKSLRDLVKKAAAIYGHQVAPKVTKFADLKCKNFHIGYLVVLQLHADNIRLFYQPKLILLSGFFRFTKSKYQT